MMVPTELQQQMTDQYSPWTSGQSERRMVRLFGIHCLKMIQMMGHKVPMHIYVRTHVQKKDGNILGP